MAGKVVIQKAVTSEGMAFPLLLGESGAPAACRSAVRQVPVCSRKTEFTTHLIPGTVKPDTEFKHQRASLGTFHFTFLWFEGSSPSWLWGLPSPLLNTSYLHPTSKLNPFQLVPVASEKSVSFYGSVQGLPSASGLNNCFISYRSLI